MRIAFAFAAFTGLLLLVAAVTAAFVPLAVENAIGGHDATIADARDIARAAKDLQIDAEREGALLLGYFGEVTTREQVDAARERFAASATVLDRMAEDAPRVAEGVQRMREIEGSLFVPPPGADLATIYEFNHRVRELQGSSLVVGESQLGPANLYRAVFPGPLSESGLPPIINNVSPMHHGLLETNPFTGSDLEARRAAIFAANAGAIRATADLGAAQLRAFAATAGALAANASDPAPALAAQAALTLAADQASAIDADTPLAEANATLAAATAAVAQAEAAGVQVTRTAKLIGVPADAATVALVWARDEVKFREISTEFFVLAEYGHAFVRAAIVERSDELSVAAAALGAEADARVHAATLARAAALEGITRSVWASGALVVLTATVAGTFILVKLVRRLGEFKEAAVSVAAGDLAGRKPGTANDEFDPLARSWASMTTSLSDAREALVRKEQLATLGSLASGVAHEINNPLAYMRGNLEISRDDLALILADPSTPESSKQTLRAILQSIEASVAGTERIATIVLGLHHLSRPGATSVDTGTVDISAIVEGTLAVVSSKAAAGVTIERDLAPGLACRTTDGREISQMVASLALNAFEAVGAAGKVRVRSRADGARCIVEVEDDGAGIPEAAQGQIFRPFYTTKHDHVGLGLAIAQRIAHANGARISFRSKPGSTVFIVEMPLSAAAPAAPREAPPLRAAVPARAALDAGAAGA